MEDEIVNKVAQSSLVIFDLEDYYPTEERVVLDISQWLFQGFILKEKEFRDNMKSLKEKYSWHNFVKGMFELINSKN